MTAITKQKKKGNLELAYKKFDWQESVNLGEAMYGKLPPHSAKLEEGILGAIMLERDVIDKVKDIISQESFYLPAHQLIYKAMMQLREKEEKIDMLTVTTQLRKNNELDEAGDAYYLAELTSRVASAANIEAHATYVQQYYMRRLMIEISTFAIKYSYEDQQDVFDVHDWMTKEVAQVTMNQRWKYKELLESIKVERTKTKNPYPIQVFPERIRKIMEEYAYCNRFPISFIGSTIMTVVSSAVGNGLRMQYSTTYKTAGSLFMALVGEPGMAKTWTIKEMARPLFRRDEILEKMHEEQMAAWREEKSDYDAANAGMKNPDPFPVPEPKMRQMVVDDFTMEALINVFDTNKKGIFGWQDELIALFNSLNAYRSGGSDGQKLLKIFDGNPVKVNRSKGNPVTVRNTFMSVAGGIQPSRLKDMANGGRIGDGTLGRFCFDFPDSQTIPEPNKDVVREDYIEEYQQLIEYILHLPNHYDDAGDEKAMKPINIPFTQAAQEAYFKWEKENNKLVNESEDSIRTVHKKLENQCLRFALIMQVIMWACEGKKIESAAEMGFMRIDIEALKAAFELIEYYRHCSLKVLDKLESPVAKLSPDFRAIYNGLSDVFRTKDAIKLADAAGISEPTLRRKLLRDRELVRPITGKSGTYQKCIA